MRSAAAAMMVVLVLLVGSSEASAVTPGLAYTEDTVFTVLDTSVRVDTTVVMTNTTTERRSGNTIYYSYFDQFQHVVPVDATSVTFTSRGRELATTSAPIDADFALVSARLPSELRSGQSRTIEISFVLPVGSIRGDSIFFSNPAFHSFPVWSFSDPGTGSLTLRVPQGAELGQFGDALRYAGRADGFELWEPRDFSSPEEVFSFVTITRDDALIEEEFVVSGQQIVLRTWPGDEVWTTFARDSIENGLPTLEELIGLPIPDQRTLEITESVTPYFYGYAGWYDPADTTIEVGNELDDSVMLHEVSHAWFNDSLFDERWVNEGLAEEFTWLAQGELGWPTETLPRTPRTSHPGWVPLVDWSNAVSASLGDDAIRDTEEYGYASSWFAIHALVEIIGVDGMQEVLAAADADTISYVGDDRGETTSMPDDWRRLLDLASHAVAEGDLDAETAVEEIFIDFVVDEDAGGDLEERREARSMYRDLTLREPNWRIPGEVRVALTLWDFEQATAVMQEAALVLDRRLEVQREAKALDLEISDAARVAYEQPEPDFDEALAILEAQADALPAVEGVRATYAQDLTMNQRWGIGEVDLAQLVAHAEQAFAVDAYDEISAAHNDMTATLAAAEVRGAERILWSRVGFGAAFLLAVMISWTLYRRSRRRRAGLDIDLARDDVVLSA